MADTFVDTLSAGFRGYFQTDDELKALEPECKDGDWAIVEITDSVWAWKEGEWANTWTKVNLPDYYTSEELGEEFNASTSNHWNIEVSPDDWAETEDSFEDIAAKYKAVKKCEGMTGGTDIARIQYIAGDRISASTASWSYLRPAEGAVELYAESIPAGEFTLRLTEVK